MTRAKLWDRNRIRLGARRVPSRCVQTPEMSEPAAVENRTVQLARMRTFHLARFALCLVLHL